MIGTNVTLWSDNKTLKLSNSPLQDGVLLATDTRRTSENGMVVEDDPMVVNKIIEMTENVL